MKLIETISGGYVGRLFSHETLGIFRVSKDNSEGKIILTKGDTDEKFLISSGDLQDEVTPIKEDTLWDRAKVGQDYWYVDENSVVTKATEESSTADTNRFNAYNYFRSQELAMDVAKQQLLYRRVRQFRDITEEGYYVDWANNDNTKHFIVINHRDAQVVSLRTISLEYLGGVYFLNEDIAERCIEEIVKPALEGNK